MQTVSARCLKPLLALALSAVLAAGGAAFAGQSSRPPTSDKGSLEAEKKVVEYLKANVQPGQRVVVSELFNNVFKGEDERKVLNRLFNTFFKIPLFVAQYRASTGANPSLADISRQFNLPIEGEAAVLLNIIDSDPRVPKFIKRDSATGEIIDVDIEAVKKDRRFGVMLERTLMGWVGKDAPPFQLELIGGTQLASPELSGKSYLLYFWFTGCPPCVKIAPHLATLQRELGGKGFTVVSANADRFLELDVTDAERAEYARKAGLTFPIGHLSKAMQETYGNVNVFPTLFLVDAKGVVRKHYVNYQTLAVLRDDVRQVLESKTSAP